MTDRSDTSGPHMEGPGVLLRRAREARGLVLRDIAQELHLDEWMLQALEEDDFPALGAPVFAKGHLRKYGSLLGLNTDDLMIAYYRKRGRDDTPPPITNVSGLPQQDRERDGWPGPLLFWLLAAIIVLMIVSGLWTYRSRDDARPTRPASSPAATVTAEPEPAATADAVLPAVTAESPVATDETAPPAEPGDAGPATDGAAMNGPADPGAETADVGVNLTAPAADVAVAANETLQLMLSFNAESWVEVTDSDGNRLLYNMVAAGRTRTVTGRPPVEVFLGRARAVELEVDGEDYPIPRSAVRGNTARFVIDDAR